MQLDHYTSKFNQQTFPIILVCDNVTSATNLGGLLRTADAFGVEKIYFCGESIEINRKALRASRATEKVVDFELNVNIDQILSTLKNNNYRIIALEITSNSQALDTTTFELNKPIALIIGDENYGINNRVLDQSHDVIHIEMFGKNSSMNVVQAASIMLYELTRQINCD